ncbi:MAG: hypothetical protein HY720_03585 [Planctomycetes bacterium]|nr:hypothetical protein [Planctomycetota bacterium]
MVDERPWAGPRDRWTFLLSLAAAAIVLGILAWPLFRGEVYWPNDLWEMHIPYRAFYAQCLERGDRFEWCPDLHCGFYLQGEGQAGMYHPFHLVLYRTLPLGIAFNLEMLAGYFLALAGAYPFLRRWEIGRGASAFGSFLFAFSGFNLLHLEHVNAVAVVAHMPWLLLAIDVALRSEHRRARGLAGAAISLLVGSELLLGYPQYVYFSGLAGIVYSVVLAVSLKRVRRLGTLVLYAALGILVGAAQLVPTWDAVKSSTRAAPDEEFLSFFSLHPVNVLQLVAPYFFAGRGFGGYTHEMGLHDGAATLALAAWLWSRRRELGPRRPLAAACLFLGLLSLLLAMGSYAGPLFQIWIRIPGLGLFRCPSRHIVLVHLSLGIAATLALDEIIRRRNDSGRFAWPVASLPVAAFLVAGLALLPKFETHVASDGAILAGPVLFAAAAGLVLGASKGSRIALLGLVLLGTADPAFYGLSHLWRQRPVARIEELLDREPAAPEDAKPRVLSDRCPLAMAGFRVTGGYVGLPPESRLDWESPAALRVAGVAWRYDREKRCLVPVSDPLPRVRLVSEAARSETPGKGLDRIDVGRIATVEEPIALEGGPPGEARLLVGRPGEIVVRTNAPGRQLLVVAERAHPGWRAEVGGESRPVVRAYGEFLACEISSGEHEVTFIFDPPSLILGRRATWAGLALVAILALACALPSRPRGRPASGPTG